MKKYQFTQWQLWAQYLQVHDYRGENPTLSKGDFFKLPEVKKVLVLVHIKSLR